jgi:hypothetical protein
VVVLARLISLKSTKSIMDFLTEANKTLEKPSEGHTVACPASGSTAVASWIRLETPRDEIH